MAPEVARLARPLRMKPSKRAGLRMNRQNESPTRRVRLTKKVVDAARANHDGKKRVRVWDTDVPQLYLQITPKGSASYCIRYVRPDGGKND